MVQSGSSRLGYLSVGFGVLCRCLDVVSLRLQPPVKKPLLDSPSVRNGAWRTTLGTNSMEHIEHGTVFALGCGTGSKCCCWTIVVAVAGSTGCRTGRW